MFVIIRTSGLVLASVSPLKDCRSTKVAGFLRIISSKKQLTSHDMAVMTGFEMKSWKLSAKSGNLLVEGHASYSSIRAGVFSLLLAIAFLAWGLISFSESESPLWPWMTWCNRIAFLKGSPVDRCHRLDLLTHCGLWVFFRLEKERRVR